MKLRSGEIGNRGRNNLKVLHFVVTSIFLYPCMTMALTFLA